MRTGFFFTLNMIQLGGPHQEKIDVLYCSSTVEILLQYKKKDHDSWSMIKPSLDTSDDEDDNKIEENENEKVPTSSSSSCTTLSRPSSCDARKQHNTVPNLQDTPFKMISLEVKKLFLVLT